MTFINPVHHATTFMRFCIVGIMNTGVDVIVYFVLTRLVGLGDFPISAKVASYFAATLNSLYVNHSWTFKHPAPITVRTIVYYFCTVGLGVFINAGIHWFGLNVVHMPDMVSVFAAAAGTAVWGFVWSRFVIFKEKV